MGFTTNSISALHEGPLGGQWFLINCDISSTIFLTSSELTSSEHFIKKIKCTTDFLSNLCHRSLVHFFFLTSMSITIINASIMQLRKKYKSFGRAFIKFIHIVEILHNVAKSTIFSICESHLIHASISLRQIICG